MRFQVCSSQSKAKSNTYYRTQTWQWTENIVNIVTSFASLTHSTTENILNR